MKFRYKIFLISFLLIIISINLIGYLIVTNNFKTDVEKEIELNISYIDSIKDTQYSLEVIQTIGGSLGSYVEPATMIFNTLNAYIQNESLVNIELYESNEIVFSNFSGIDNDIKEKLSGEDFDTKSYIIDKNGKIYLYMASNFTIKDKSFKIITCKDISQVYIKKDEQVEFFKKIAIFVTLAISVILYVFVYLITRRLRKINKALEKVANKQYNIELKNLGNDEIGELAQSVNEMAISIDNNINEIEKISKNRQDFINNLTHEIRTPLTSIIGFSGLINMNEELNEETIKEYSSRIYEEGFYLKNISDKLTNLILLDNNEKVFENVNISKLINNVCDNMMERANKYNVHINKYIYDDIYILGDEDLLKSLIINILNNAIKACSKRENVTREINVILTEKKELHVADNGLGIEKGNLEKIKEPFYTLDKSRNKEISGIGLGLTLCVKIALVHNAKIDILSKVNEGTDVVVTFECDDNEKAT